MQEFKKIFTFKEWPETLRYLALATFLMSVAMGLRQTSFTNFVNDLGIQASQLGWIESIREIPGLLTVFMAMLTYFVTESLLAAISLFILGGGMFFYSVSTNFSWLVLASVTYSIGFHLFFPLRDSMALKLGTKEEGGKQLGRMGSIGALASLVGMASVIGLSKVTDYRTIFIIATISGLLAGAVMFRMPKPAIHLRPRTLVFKRRYLYYYILTFLSGCRRHIFTIFAPFVLVNIFEVNLTTMAILMTINQLLNIYARPKIGKLIDATGEKLALTINYGTLIFVFLGYAFINILPVLFLLYIIDNICFGFNMAVSTYLHKICPGEDLSPSLAMGSTINHIAAIFIPIIGGALWDQFGYQAAFLMGAVIVSSSLIITFLIKDFSRGSRDRLTTSQS